MTSWLKGLIVAGVLLGTSLTLLGLFAAWWPALDIVNNGLPFVAAGVVLILGLAVITRDWRLILPASLVAAVNVMLVIGAWQGGAAEAAPGSQRFVRVVTFNLWFGNDRMDAVAKFLAETDADIVVLQEVTREHGTALRRALGSLYPFALGETRLVILSKHPILAEGRIDRSDFPPWNSLMLRWVRLDVNGTTFELAGVHLARPFYPELQQQDIAALTEFVWSRTMPLVIAGDFNMSPWTEKLANFTEQTGLMRYNTLHLTWPMRYGNVPLLPLVATDNVFASHEFAALATHAGPRLGSDHKAVVADIALAVPVAPGEK